MAAASTIEWTESTWNPVVGCAKVSEGCRHCYAERMAKRIAGMARSDEALGLEPGRKANYKAVAGASGWTGRIVTDRTALRDPFRWRKPRVVFVNSMSDLFHAKVSRRFIEEVFAVMVACPQHTFQLLTKRPERVRELGSELPWTDNIWLGTSVENSDVVDRIRHLQKTPARVRFISAEPLLGPLDKIPLSGIHWVIAGGESGPGARPVEKAWVRNLRDRCVASGVAFFFKQWGGINKKKAGRRLDGRDWDQMPTGVRVG